jgi:integrase
VVVKLTAKTIDTIVLPAGKAELVMFDEDIAGFFVRVRAGGSRTFGYQYKLGTKHRRMTLGSAVKEAFPEIRKRVMDLQAQVRLGQDPAATKETAKQQAAETFKAIADLYLAKQGKAARPKTRRESTRYLCKLAKPLHGRPVAAITRRDIAELLAKAEAGVTSGSGAVTANRLRSALSSLFAWAMREGLCEANPVIATNQRAEASRERVLTMSELAEVWRALEGIPAGDAVRLLMLTGQREAEIGGLRWVEVDDGLSRITLPGSRTKNKQEHIVPLSEPAREILARRPHVVGWACIFTAGEGGFVNWGRLKKNIDRKPHEARVEAFGADATPMPHWTFHDLRRSVATHMGDDLDVLPHVIEATLNHRSGSKRGVAGIYNHARYLPHTTAALTLWAEHLMAAVTGAPAKVVPLRA